MKKKFVLYICIISMCLCSCGNGKKDSEIPILNEKGKEEITFCILGTGTFLKEAIVEYNKQSTRYEIVPVTMEDTPYLEYRKRVQLDLMNGKGPDILETSVLNDLDMRPYAEKGYLLDLTDYIKELEPMLEKVVGFNELNGQIYGIPYGFDLTTVTVKGKYQTTLSNWTKDYCMKLMENSEATFGSFSHKLLRFFGVGIEGIQSFVDEKNGISHFDNKEFIELLEFTKKYECIDDGRTLKGRISADTQIFVESTIQTFKEFWELEGLFKALPSYMGYPTKEGGKTHLMVYSYYVNANTKHKEGALDFINFLLSDEQQLKRQKIGDGFTVKEELLKTSWEKAKQEPYLTNYGFQTDDTFYKPRVMTEEEENIFWEMLDNTVYMRPNPIDIIVYEESSAFFDGNKTAEEVAKIIDNRVQLYLDERK